MSASREKKLRQEQSSAKWVSSRDLKNQQAEASRKRRDRIYIIIGVVVAVLIIALLLWYFGVFSQDKVVATIDGEDYVEGQMAYYYYNNSVLSNAQVYANYGMSDSYPYSLDEKASEQTITEDDAEMLGIEEEYVGGTYQEYFIQSALHSMVQEHVLLKAAEENGITLSESGQESIESNLESLDESRENYLTSYGVSLSRTKYLQMIYGDSMTESLYKTCMENNELAYEVYNSDLFNELTADIADDEEALDEYYDEHKDTLDTLYYYYATIDGAAETTTDEDGNEVEPTEEESEAAMEAAKKEADELEEKVKDDFSLVEDDEQFTRAGGVLEDMSESDTGYDFLMDSGRKQGDTTVIEGTECYYVIVFDERYLDTSDTVDFRHILIEAVNEDDPDTEEDESANEATDEALDAAHDRAEEIENQWLDEGGTEDQFAELANEYSDDTGSNTNGGLYTKVYNGEMVDSVNDWLFDSERKSGDYDLIYDEDYSGWHIMYYVGSGLPVWKITAIEDLWMDQIQEENTVTTCDDLYSIFD